MFISIWFMPTHPVIPIRRFRTEPGSESPCPIAARPSRALWLHWARAVGRQAQCIMEFLWDLTYGMYHISYGRYPMVYIYISYVLSYLWFHHRTAFLLTPLVSEFITKKNSHQVSKLQKTEKHDQNQWKISRIQETERFLDHIWP